MSARPQGRIRGVVGTNPAPGVEISETVPAGRRWRFFAMIFDFTTSGVGAAREVRLVIGDGVNGFYRLVARQTQAISLTYRYMFAEGFFPGQAVFGALNVVAGEMTANILLEPGSTIVTTTTNLAAGDDYATPGLYVEEWFTPP